MEKTNYKEVYKKVSEGKMKAVKPMGGDMPKMDHKWYPSFNLSDKDIPAAKDWKVGNTYKIEMEVKQSSMRHDSMGHSFTFEIKKIKPIT